MQYIVVKAEPTLVGCLSLWKKFGSCQIHSDPPDNILSSMLVILATSYCHFRAHLGWMFEPEDSATEDQKRPSEAGFYAIILDKVIDEVRFVQSFFVFSYSYSYFVFSYFVFSYSYSYFVFSYSLYEVTLCFNFFFCPRIS